MVQQQKPVLSPEPKALLGPVWLIITNTDIGCMLRGWDMKT